jgi:hypothetical protein
MHLHLRYNTSTHDIELPDDATVRQLQAEILRRLAIPPVDQKLIFRGKPIQLQGDLLSSLKIGNGAKIMLVAAGKPVRVPSPSRPPLDLDILPQYACRIHDSILALGPPTGAISGCMGASTSTLPNSPLIVRTANGLAEFSLETDGLFLKYATGSPDRIFFTDLAAVGSVPIGNGAYSVIAVQTKLETITWIAFVPAQYTGAIISALNPFASLINWMLYDG